MELTVQKKRKKKQEKNGEGINLHFQTNLLTFQSSLRDFPKPRCLAINIYYMTTFKFPSFRKVYTFRADCM